MNVLGIETSCDETAAAVVIDGEEVRSNVVSSQIAKHADFGGVVPELAAREHLTNISAVVETALAESGLTISDIDAVAATCRPGLIPALLVGLSYAKGIAASGSVRRTPVLARARSRAAAPARGGRGGLLSPPWAPAPPPRCPGRGRPPAPAASAAPLRCRRSPLWSACPGGGRSRSPRQITRSDRISRRTTDLAQRR